MRAGLNVSGLLDAKTVKYLVFLQLMEKHSFLAGGRVSSMEVSLGKLSARRVISSAYS